MNKYVKKINLFARFQISSKTRKCFHTSTQFLNKGEDLEHDCSELLYDETYLNLFPEFNIKNTSGRFSVFALQPDLKDIPKKLCNTTANLKLSELCSLIESVPGWSVKDKAIHSLKRQDKNNFFGKGKLEELSELFSNHNNIDAIALGVGMLNSNQLSNLQKHFNKMVYDRYTIVLQIFQSRATNYEAKLQVSLAEIHYLKCRLHGMHSGSLDLQKEGLKMVGGLGKTSIDNRKQILNNRELKIEKELLKLKNVRHVARKNRLKHEIPIVAVVGYTNAGKTSLIKSLTGDVRLIPKDQLFATLDLTCFSGNLPNKLKVLYLDTVGFISDIPSSLMQSFHTTLKDVVDADLLVHIRDVSHPDTISQNENVIQTLKSLPDIKENLIENMICVGNKVDLLTENQRLSLSTSELILLSVVKGYGIMELMNAIQEGIMRATGRIIKKLRVPIGSSIMTWLYKEATIENIKIDSTNPEMYLIEVSMTQVSYSKLSSLYKSKTLKSAAK